MANLEDDMSKLSLEELYDRLHATRMSRRGAKKIRVDEEGKPKPVRQTRPQGEKVTSANLGKLLSPAEKRAAALRILEELDS